MRKKRNSQANTKTKREKDNKRAIGSQQDDSDYDMSLSPSGQHVPKSKKQIKKVNTKAESKSQKKVPSKSQAKQQPIKKSNPENQNKQQPKGYTAAELAKYEQWRKKLIDYKNAELKQMLKKNMQSMSGNKDQMVAKVADGIVLGKIPRCPNCFGGRPKYNYIEGTYFCKGYHDDEQMKECNSTFTRQELKRQTWQM